MVDLSFLFPSPLISKEIPHHTYRAIKRYVPGSLIDALADFDKRFATEENCFAFLFAAKWPAGFCCPRCAHGMAYVINCRRLPIYQCQLCQHQTSLTVNTIMEKSHTPLRKWLLALFLATRIECGINAMQLHTILNVTYKTAWTMLHRIRHAISEADSPRLSGAIKGSLGLCSSSPIASSSLHLQPQEKPVVIAASLNQNNHPLYIKIKLLPIERDARSMCSLSNAARWFKDNYIEKGVENVTFLQRAHFRDILHVKNLFENVNRWFTYTYRGLQRQHLQSYLDHACYLINMTLGEKPIFEGLSRLCMSTHCTDMA